MKNKKLYGIVALATLVVLVVGSVAAFGLGFNSENKEEIKAAIASGDYETWRTLMEAELSEEAFDELQEKHELMDQIMPLKQQLKIAIEEGDEEAIADFKAQIQELMPEEGWAYKRGFKHGSKAGTCGGSGSCGKCPYTK